MNIEMLIAPIVGATIGIITNSIAIKMLFRPLRPIKVFNFTIPFTQGIIPKEKARIASTVATTVSDKFLNEKALKKQLLSEKMYRKIEMAIDEWYVSNKQSSTPLKEKLATYSSDRLIVECTNDLMAKIEKEVYEGIVALNIGQELSEEAVVAIKNNFGALSMFINDSMIESAREKLEQIINQMVEEKGEEYIKQFIADQGEKILDTEIGCILGGVEEHLPKIKYALINQYKQVVEGYSTQIIEAINIEEMIEEEINDMDLLEIEKIILSIAKKELTAIVWLGGILGASMGLVMNLIK